MLLAPRAGAASAGFLTGWVVGIVVTATVVTAIAYTVGLSASGGGSTAGGVIKIVLGALMVLLAVRSGVAGRTPAANPRCRVAVPVVGHSLAPAKAHAWLSSLKNWLIANDASVMVTLFLVIGVVLIGKGIDAL